VVVGPTAAGKSGLALRLAAALDGEVLSADSQQVYRRFDIGTGKLTPEEREGIGHHLIDVADPNEAFSAARFVELADAAVEQIAGRGRRVVVAGGTGLYVRALLHGLFSTPPPDAAIRERHRLLWLEAPEGLCARLAAVDAESAARINPHDFIRISRALEVFEQTGVPISALHRAHGFATIRYSAVLVGIAPPREELRRRIEERVDAMVGKGWVEEVRALMAQGYGESRAMGCLGYRHLRAHLRGALDLGEAIRQTKRDTWRFARRQMNWFSTEPGIVWYKDAAEVDAARAGDFLSR
jgi:tRNA dimethylallyltransferase